MSSLHSLTTNTKRKDKDQELLFSLDERGRQLKGWTNKLIWGDNKLILSSLKNGPLRDEIEKQGGLKLIYIDPPFDVGGRLLDGHRDRRRHLHEKTQHS